MATEKDPGGGRTRMPGSSSAAKLVNGIPQHSSLPWHRVVYGDGDFVRQSKRRCGLTCPVVQLSGGPVLLITAGPWATTL
jgi:hypothetical protein